ncbi:hypothetical protein L6452_33101 [Arctium lappa]|uniref:Uncharacterized protein n=1 Tax=Arctium lappa TaxID=4217 RepID=A0ACB8Z6M9_ARCLA|nr:hypothetical protein L6452_33101 [Arctium lappa]
MIRIRSLIQSFLSFFLNRGLNFLNRARWFLNNGIILVKYRWIDAIRFCISSSCSWSISDCENKYKPIRGQQSAPAASKNVLNGILTGLPKLGGGEFGKFYSLPALNDPRVGSSLNQQSVIVTILQVTKEYVEKIIDWEKTDTKQVEIPFNPARVLLQDFTGVPAVVDLACMCDAIKNLGGNSDKINPLVPVDLVVDHSVQVDVARSENAVKANMELEFQRNKERFAFLKWGSKVFQNMLVVSPGSIVHQVNLEYLGRVVFNTDGMLYPDSVVGTDSHTTMIDGLGVASWGVGGIEAKATMLGQV